MSGSTGPRLFFPCEVVAACIAPRGTFSLSHCLSTVIDEDERTWQLREFCTPFLKVVRHPENHFSSLDIHLTTLLPKALNSYPSALSSCETPPPFEGKRSVLDIIRRLPTLPQRLFALPFINSGSGGTFWDGIRDGQWANKYVLPEARHQVGSRALNDEAYDPETILGKLSDVQDLVWANLYVTNFVDTNFVILAIKVAQEGTTANIVFARDFLAYINMLADLINEFEYLDSVASLKFARPFSDPTPSVQALREVLFPEVEEGHKQGRDIVKVFLWTVWQRCVMLYFYYLLQVQLQQGCSAEWSSLFAIQGIKRLEELDSGDYRGDGIEYMCNWAFQILRTNRSSLGLDFRTMLIRFESHFQRRSGRCNDGSDLTCEGNYLESCQRFTGAETLSQSKHVPSCNGNCGKIGWSEKSYRSYEGARAVHFDTSESSLQYCRASQKTMAVSHVWSHGQGGRPEQGINTCLHKQYSFLAQACNCDSYWIDSTCVPSERDLRMEAIGTINTVFATSKVVLISDADLETIDLSTSNIETLETLLSILLVCDWNVRAWTMLEAIRGRNNINILCGDNKMIPLTSLFHTILNQGAIDLAVLLGSAQHLLPSDNVQKICIEDAGFLLNKRHTSRPADAVIIWGLLNNLSGEKSASNIWKSQKGVRTGFLISSVSRLEIRGYSWAPRAPYIRPQKRSVSLNSSTQKMQNYMVCYQSYDGQGSYFANNLMPGLEGKWLVRDMTSKGLALYRDNFCYTTPLEFVHSTQLEFNLHLDGDVNLYEQPDTGLACDIIERLLSTGYKVRTVRPLAECGTMPYMGGIRRGESYGMVAAICSVRPGGEKWKWEGVYQWLEEIDDDRWGIEDMIIW